MVVILSGRGVERSLYRVVVIQSGRYTEWSLCGTIVNRIVTMWNKTKFCQYARLPPNNGDAHVTPVCACVCVHVCVCVCRCEYLCAILVCLSACVRVCV